jgi:hypothetical protein
MNIYKNTSFEYHLNNLEKIIMDSGESLEGNCVYLDNSLIRDERLYPKQNNLFNIAKYGNKILEIGFNAGHSSLIFLLSNPFCTIQLFDLGNHSYSKLCFEYLEKEFPNRLNIIWGNSQETLLKYTAEKIGTTYFDIIHIDGSHNPIDVRNDVLHSKLLSNLLTGNTYLIYDDVWMHVLFQLYQELLIDVLIPVNNIFEPCSLYDHALCKFKRSKIAILSLYLGEEFKNITFYSLVCKINYCIKHNYDLIIDEQVYDMSRPYPWSKIKLIQKYLYLYEYVVWLDADLLIMNLDTKLESFINPLMNDIYITESNIVNESSTTQEQRIDILLAHDKDILNTGVMFIRNCEWSYKFFELLYAQEQFINSNLWDQDSFIYLYENNINNSKNHIHHIFQITFNSYWYNFEYGQFILHFCGCRPLAKLNLALTTYCNVKRFDETYEDFEKRIFWIKHFARESELNKLKNM